MAEILLTIIFVALIAAAAYIRVKRPGDDLAMFMFFGAMFIGLMLVIKVVMLAPIL
jgi:archaellum biogenesis protein FlaJ (TadC family)